MIVGRFVGEIIHSSEMLALSMLMLQDVHCNMNRGWNGDKEGLHIFSDVNECFDSSLFDCHSEAVCANTFGSYSCLCKKGFTDR